MLERPRTRGQAHGAAASPGIALSRRMQRLRCWAARCGAADPENGVDRAASDEQLVELKLRHEIVVLFGDDADAWLHMPHPRLEGARPADLLGTVRQPLVEDLIASYRRDEAP